MIDECRSIGGHIDERLHGKFPRCAVDCFECIWDVGNILDGSVGKLDLGADSIIPKAHFLEILYQIGVDLQEVSREGFTLEEVGYLWLDTFIAAGDGCDGCSWGDCNDQGVAKPVCFDLFAKCVKARTVVERYIPKIELQNAFCCFGLRE